MPKRKKPPLLKVALFQRILAVYREPIFRLLSDEQSFTVTFYSARKNTYNSVKTIDPRLATCTARARGLRWRFLKNLELGHFVWQTPSVFNREATRNDVYVFEGSVYSLSSWAMSIVGKLYGKKIIMWTHGFIRDERGLKNVIRTAYYSLADLHLLYGNRAKTLMLRRGFRNEQLHVIYNSLDYDTHMKTYSRLTEDVTASIKGRYFQQPNLPLLLFIGRLSRRKRLTQLLHALKILSQKGMPCNTIFIGDGAEMSRLKALAHTLQLTNHTHFFGSCYDADITSEIVYAADACVSPGEVGLTAVHALSFGTPVITHGDLNHQMPEVEAIKHRHNGMLYKRDSAADLASAISDWLDNNPSRGLVRTKCREIVHAKYNPHYQLSVFKRAISEVVALRPR